jgi:hypothetical protein
MFHVEHEGDTNLNVKAVTVALMLAMASLTNVRCSKPMADPEQLDPIYVDLAREAASGDKAVEEQEKKLKALREDIEKFEPRDPFRKRSIAQAYQLEKSIVQLKQQALYLQVRAQQRKEYDRMSYLKAFDEGMPWPGNQAEVSGYQVRKRLQNASRNWEARVPKLTRHNKGGFAVAGSGKEGTKGEGGSGGHGSGESESKSEGGHH